MLNIIKRGKKLELLNQRHMGKEEIKKEED